MNSTEANSSDGERPQHEVSRTGRTQKSKTHWAEWEIGCLIGRTLEGVRPDVIADGMGRTRSACRTMLKRLIDGEVECPAADAEMLEKLREQNTPKTCQAKQNQTQIIEQYKTLARNNDLVRLVLQEVEQMITYSLALDVIDERITLDEIAHLCSGETTHAVRNAIGKIRLFRKEHAEMFAGKQSAVSNQRSAEEKTDR